MFQNVSTYSALDFASVLPVPALKLSTHTDCDLFCLGFSPGLQSEAAVQLPPHTPYLAPGEVVLDTVNREGNHLHIALLKLRCQLCCPAELCGADGCEVPRVGEENAPSEREQEMALGQDVCTANKKLYRLHCMGTCVGTAHLSTQQKTCPEKSSFPVAGSPRDTSPIYHAE